MGKKRKRGPVVLDDPSDETGPSSMSNGFGVAGTLAALRSTEPPPPVVVNSAATGWQTVESSRKKRKRVDGEKVKYPTLTYAGGRLQSSVKISDLQGLLLYCFSDGLAPQWISVKHSGHVRKIVVLMVPGLEKGMFDGSDPAESGFQRWLRGDSPVADSPSRYNPVPLKADSLPQHLQPVAEIFPHVWPVKSPGDAKYNKIHSPLQAFLLAPLPTTKGGGPKPPRESTTRKLQRTPITKFLLTVADLKENDYVLHPALFDSHEEKVQNADVRRAANQTLEVGWVDTDVSNYSDGSVPEKEIPKGGITAGRDVYAVDCEMCITQGGGFDLTRISVVSWDGEVILDELVKPEKPIIDYLTQYSGITKEKLESVNTTLSDIQTRLTSILTPRSILVGHSLHSDLNALKMTHPFIIDTTVLYPHPRGPPLKSSLKWLAQKYLGREIQKGTAGHDSIEDARTALDLVKQKCEKGEHWGSADSSNESIFIRLARSKKNGDKKTPDTPGRTGAVVDWGNPERGYGASAAVAIGCKNDEEVVAGVSRAVNGSPDGGVIPDGGVDFVWARLRELEIARGWCNRIPNPANMNASVSIPENNETNQATLELGALGSAVAKSVTCIQRIYESLPPCTLLMVYSGTGDPRQVSRLQALHKTYLDEFRSRKPWNQLSVKWTDVEEQSLKRACQQAREGCAFMAVR